MFLNHLKAGIRNIRRYKAFSFINAFGLALAMSVCMLIILMLLDQKGYDQFHTKKNSIYRILSETTNGGHPYATSPVPLAGVLKADYPVVEESVRLIRGVGGDINYEGRSAEVRGFFSDPSFFDVFSFELEKGNKSNALLLPASMVISSACAHRLFGDENPIGKTIEFVDRGLPYLEGAGNETSPTHWGTFTITGVMADERHKSHLKFDALVSASSMDVLQKEKKMQDLTNDWTNHYQCFTYVVLAPGKNRGDLNAALNNLADLRCKNIESLKGFKLMAQNLTQITPGVFVGNPSSYSMPAVAYYFLVGLAFMIMVSACLNYANLSTARALTRAKEIGIRKVTGASRRDLMSQFIIESIITSMLALGLAILLLFFIRPAFTGLWVNRYLNFDLEQNILAYALFVTFALVIGIVSGVFPSLYLSKYQPVKALKNSGSDRPGKWGMRKILSVTQFVISLFFITTSIVIFNQFKHFVQFEYGFNPDSVINVALQGQDYQKVLNELSSVPGVSAISACDIIPATGLSNGIGLKKDPNEGEFKNFGLLLTDENFLDNLKIKMIAGKNLQAHGESSDQFILLNKAAVKELGYKDPAEAIGKIVQTNCDNEALQVIGVVEDFRFRLLINQDKIGPLILRNKPGNFKFANVKIASSELMATVGKLEAKWKSIDPVHPFKYSFFDEQLATTHQVIRDVVWILSFIALLAISIACLGLLGMATYAAERRTREVGIRKICGAENGSIVLLLSREFLKILIISVCIAGPLSYFFNSFWLRNFPNRIDFGIGTVLLAAFILFTLGLITIGSQTIRASKSNPVDTLRMD